MRTRARLALLSLVMMTLFVLVAAIPPSAANGRGGGHGGGGHRGGGHHGSWQRSGWHRGWHGGYWGPRVFIGSPFWYPGPYAYPYPVYAPPLYAPPIVQEPLPLPAYVEPRSSAYWYYCQDPPGYYPYVGTCAGEWQPVAPQPSAPAP